MAEQLTLVKRPDLGADIDEFDLLPEIVEDGWRMNAQNGDQTIDESITLNLQADNQDALAAHIQALDAKITEVKQSRYILQPNGVWLRAQLSDETNPRQSYVVDARRTALPVAHNLIGQSFIYHYQLGLTRMPLWEALQPETIAETDLSALGGRFSYSLVGDEPGRIAAATIQYVSPSEHVGKTINEIWIGFKTDLVGNPENFQTDWDLTRASTLGPDTSVASGNVVCTFGTTPGRDVRVRIRVIDAYTFRGNPYEIGRYRVLLRARTTSTADTLVRVGSGFGAYHVGDYQRIANTRWALYDMGDFDIPPTAWGSADPGLAELVIEAQLYAGSGHLEMDYFYLIPSLEGSIHAFSENGLIDDLESNHAFEIYTRPDYRRIGLKTSGASITTIANLLDINDAQNWIMPKGSGIVVVAAQSSAAAVAGTEFDISRTDDVVSVSLQVLPGWNMLRGDQ